MHIGQITSLKSLDLDGNQITSAGLAHLEGLSSLSDLSLSDMNIDDAGLSHLTGLTKLERLNLAGCKVSDNGWNALTQPKLESLDLSRCQITGAGLNTLTQLKTLELNKVKITDSVLAGLVPLDLTHLSLNGTDIDISGLEKLAGMHHLEILSLRGCEIDDSAIPVLKKFPSLKWVWGGIHLFSKTGKKQLEPINAHF